MRRSFFLLIISLSVITQMVSSQVYINEFMQSNIDCVRDDLNEFPDSWVELYNKSDEYVDIKGWYISDKKNYEKGYKIPESTIIPAKGYQLIYCDKAEIGLHTSFRLESGNGCNIYLFDENGEKVDEIKDFPKQPAPNIAWGREEDGARDWVYFVTATPGDKNEGATSNILLPSPVFNIAGGVYRENVIVELSLPENAPEGVVLSDIRYTTDGSEPTIESESYSEAIEISNPTPVRAKIITPGYLINRSFTQTYIIADREFTLPIVSLSLDPEYLWDDEFGIYVKGNDKWEKANYEYDWRRPVNMEYFPSQNEESVINQLEETRVSGGYSRNMGQKSLIMYANKRFGEKRINYQLFDEKPNQEIKSFMLRSSGNDFWNTMFRDAAIQLFMGEKVNLDYQAYQPSILFINGQYMGIENLRERSNEDFVLANYNGLEDIDMLENWPGTNSELKAGDKVAINDMMEKLRLPDDQIPYQEILNMVDVDEFINFMILQIYVANTDFPQSNVVLWRPKTEDGKWRFILKDTDFGLGFSNPVTHNTLHYNMDLGHAKTSKLLFTKLMNEPTFREQFTDRFAIYMGDLLHSETTISVIDSIQQIISTEMYSHKKRWVYDGRDYEWWLGAVERMREWCRNRNPHMYEHLNDELELKGLTPLQITVSDAFVESTTLSFNGITLKKTAFDGAYYIGRTIKLEAEGKEFSDDSGWLISFKVKDIERTREILGKELEFTVPEECTDLQIELRSGLTSVQEIGNSSIQIITNNSVLHITGLQEGKTSHISIYDTTGRLITEKSGNESHVSVPLIQKGIFFVKVKEGQEVLSGKIVNE